MVHIYSTLSADTAYAIYVNNDVKSLPVIERSILIRGGANVSNKHFVTPKGVVTQISPEDYQLLQADYHFCEHLKHGFISVEKSNVAIEKVVKNMTPKDEAAPKTPEDPDFHGTTKVAEVSLGKKGKK